MYRDQESGDPRDVWLSQGNYAVTQVGIRRWRTKGSRNSPEKTSGFVEVDYRQWDGVRSAIRKLLGEGEWSSQHLQEGTCGSKVGQPERCLDRTVGHFSTEQAVVKNKSNEFLFLTLIIQKAWFWWFSVKQRHFMQLFHKNRNLAFLSVQGRWTPWGYVKAFRACV